MLMMAVSGAVVLALVCWTFLNEPPPSFTPFIPHPDSGERAGRAATAPDGEAPQPARETTEPGSDREARGDDRDDAPWELADEPAGDHPDSGSTGRPEEPR